VFSWGKGDREGGEDTFEPRNPFDGNKFKNLDLFFVTISSGYTHSACVNSRGELYMWGDSADACQGRPKAEGSNRSFSYCPIMVDYFNE
jgi:alpha-tubulin suppressor-like RCC1 family protein